MNKIPDIDMRLGPLLFLVTLLACQSMENPVLTIYVEPVLKLDIADPTEDKPQSKIWYAYDTWWALLPKSSGPSLWKRAVHGWEEQDQFRDRLCEQPGKADVFHDDSTTLAVLVKKCELKILKLEYSESLGSYIPELKATLPIPKDCESIETATIVKDRNGIYWVASDMNTSILVWQSTDEKNWSTPYIIANNISADDICTITNLDSGVSVIWSNQDQQAVYESVCHNSAIMARWSEPILIEKGNRTSDDHLNTTLLDNGTLLLVSKNSLDKIGRPQFVLRVRDSNGNWDNLPYANLTASQMPTRPVITRSVSGEIFEAHSVKNVNAKDYHISFSSIERTGDDDWIIKEIIRVKSKGTSLVNNVTVSKEPFSENGTWIALFSDKAGHVFEIDLKRIVN